MVSPIPGLTAAHRAALPLQSFCDERQWRACFIGGLALQRWGEPCLTGFGGEGGFVDALLGRFKGREADARRFALLRRVLRESPGKTAKRFVLQEPTSLRNGGCLRVRFSTFFLATLRRGKN